MKTIPKHRTTDRITGGAFKPQYTLKQIADKAGRSVEAVRKLEMQAFEKFRERWHELEQRGWPGLGE